MSFFQKGCYGLLFLPENSEILQFLSELYEKVRRDLKLKLYSNYVGTLDVIGV